MTERLRIVELPLPGLFLLERSPIRDERGYLERIFCAEILAQRRLNTSIAQINHTLTVRAGSIRGMHFQVPPHSEAKSVTCLRGKVFDVAVDLRRHSATFLQWHAEVLSADNHLSLYIPEGFAHGFQTLEDNCEMHYLHSAPYRASAEGGLSPFESRVAINWPLAPTELSPRDRNHPPLTAEFAGLIL